MFRLMMVAAVCVAAGSAQTRPVRPAEFAQICGAEIERFCPTLSGTTETRNQRICLQPYRSSLGRSCRRAMAAPR